MRGVPRWLAVLAVVATGAVVCAFTVRHAMAPATLVLQLSDATVPADGFTSTELRIYSIQWPPSARPTGHGGRSASRGGRVSDG